MNEIAIIEAVRAAQGVNGAQAVDPAALTVTVSQMDPAAVTQFQAAMGVKSAEDVPFASQVAGVWNGAQASYQSRLHRIESLTAMMEMGQTSAAQLSTLQYEVASLSFQQEVVTNVAKKSSDAIQTLVKNG